MSERKDKVSELLAKAREAACTTPEATAIARQHIESIQERAMGRTLAAERLAALLRDAPEIDDPQVAAAFRGVTGVLAALLGVEVEDAG
jgi:hypothetical protein